MPKPPVKKIQKENDHEAIKAKNKRTTMELEDIDPEKAETIARFNQERLRRKDHGCVDFWACLVFQSWEQLQEFLSQVKSPVLYDVYIDGEEFAKEVGKPVTPNQLPPVKVKLNAKRTAMVKLQDIRKANQ